MKIKVVVTGLMAVLIASASFAQSIENDDMYFTSKDRVKLKAKQAEDEVAYQASVVRKNTRRNNEVIEEQDANPSDSYSARNVNPEFAARSNSQEASADNEDYFVSDYRYNNSSNLNSWNNNFNTWYSNPWYASNYFSPSIYGWNTPYYGSYYDSWGNPWMNPYYRSGWSSSFSYYYGSSWNYGWGSSYGMSFGYGNPYMNSWYGWNSPYYGYGYNYWYPSTIVVVGNGDGGRNVVYGKRGTRGGAITTRQEATSGRTRGVYSPGTGSTSGRTTDAGGRSIATTSTMPTRTTQRQDDYYNRSWRTSQQSQGSTSPSRSSGMWSTPSRSSNSSFGNRNDNSNFSNNSFNSGSRSSSFNNSGNSSGATRSSGGSFSGGGGSNGRTRGRD